MDLVGERVRLRAPRPLDAERLLAIRSDPEVARFASLHAHFPPDDEGWARGETLERVRTSLMRRGQHEVQWVVDRRDDRAVIGSALLFRLDFRNRNAWLNVTSLQPLPEAVTLITRFAFRQLGLEKVYAGVLEGDARSMAMYREAGFEVEAALERQHLVDGRLVTEYWLATYRDSPAAPSPESPSPRGEG